MYVNVRRKDPGYVMALKKKYNIDIIEINLLLALWFVGVICLGVVPEERIHELAS